ncbi:MAG: 50S ribosomal protein L14 [Candidatus Absconditabacteria bacterium]|nr:50S ribosomal protein L14 [Candidatus Absconditabacteria bacterium]
MLKTESIVTVADNTGVKKVKIIRILKSSMARTARIADMVVVAVQEVAPTSTIKKGEVAQAMVVRVRKEITRKDGTYVRFGDNAVILMSKDAKGEVKPIGKRIFGPVARELRDLGYRNITNMAEEVV